jgi:Cu(I)/Ag(I) efflux system membrane protein CusA/SilA
MIAKLIRWSVANRFLVLLATAMLTAWGVWGVRSTPVDALPDLSDVQVIIRTSYPGQAPQIVENQVTYPLATTMLSVPGAKTVRGFSFFGDSFVYVLFEDGTDLYWARSRVLEYLNQVQGRLPATAKPALGPDATGVGWIFQYALVDRTGKNDLAQLRALQDWFLKFELKSLPNVAEVASVGGMVKQYQVVLDPIKLASYGLSQGRSAMRREGQPGDRRLGAGAVRRRVHGARQRLPQDPGRLPADPLVARGGVPVRLGDVATLQIGPEMRRGIAELDGEGEVAGGVVVLRSGKNAQETIAAVKAKLAELQASLPPGVEIVTTYDRSALIERAIRNLTTKLGEEFLVVALVCTVPVASALGAGGHHLAAAGRDDGLPRHALPGHQRQHHVAGGIAIAVGAMVDAAVVMIENAHKKLEAWQHAHPDQRLQGKERWDVITQAAEEVGPALFFSLLIITCPSSRSSPWKRRRAGCSARWRSPRPTRWPRPRAVGDADSRAHGLLDSRAHSRRAEEPHHPHADCGLPASLEWVLRWPKATLLIAVLAWRPRPGRWRGSAASFCRGWTRGPALHALGPAGAVGAARRRAAAAEQPHDQDRARGRQGVRQGRTRRNCDRSRAAGDVRDHGEAQAQGAMASRHDAREARRGAGSCREDPRPVQHLDSAHPQPHRHAGHRHQEPDRGQGDRQRPGRDRPHRGRGRAGRQGHSRRDVIPGGAVDGRPLRGRSDRPRPPVATA